LNNDTVFFYKAAPAGTQVSIDDSFFSCTKYMRQINKQIFKCVQRHNMHFRCNSI